MDETNNVDNIKSTLSELILSPLVQFSNYLMSLDFEECKKTLKDVIFTVPSTKIKSKTPEIYKTSFDALMKYMKLLIDVFPEFYKLEYTKCFYLKITSKIDKYSSNGSLLDNKSSNSGIGEDFKNKIMSTKDSKKQGSEDNNSQKTKRKNSDVNKAKDSVKYENSDKGSNSNQSSNELDIVNVDSKDLDRTITQNITIIQKIFEMMELIANVLEELKQIHEKFIRGKLSNTQINNSNTNQQENEENKSKINLYFDENLIVGESFIDKNNKLKKMKKEIYEDKAKEKYYYSRNTFLPILNKLIFEAETLFGLVKGYYNILNLDPIGSMECMLITVQNIEKMKKSQKNMNSFDFYRFIQKFYYNNKFAMDLFFYTYFLNKQKSLSVLLLKNYDKKEKTKEGNNINEKNNINQSNENVKKEENKGKVDIMKIVFQFSDVVKPNENLIANLLNEKVELDYFIFIFEKNEKKKCDEKKSQKSDQLGQDKMMYKQKMFYDLLFEASNEEFAIIINYYNSQQFQNLNDILNDFSEPFKIFLSNNFNNENGKNGNLNDTGSISGKESSIKSTNKKNCTYEFFKFSNFITVCCRYKEKKTKDSLLVKKICQNIISQQIAGMSFFEMIQNHKEEKNEQKEINKN